MLFSKGKAGTWLRTGRRLEYTILAVCVTGFLWMAFIILRGAPRDMTVRAILWVYVGLPPLVISVLVFEFGPSLRKYAESKVSGVRQPRNLASRLRVYFLVTLVIIFASIRVGGGLVERNIISVTALLNFFYFDLAILVFYIVSSEVKIWRSMGQTPRGDPSETSKPSSG
jgi:hypothetical protein